MKRHAFRVNSITLYSQVASKNTHVARQSTMFLYSRCNPRGSKKNFETAQSNSSIFKIAKLSQFIVTGSIHTNFFFFFGSKLQFQPCKYPNIFISSLIDKRHIKFHIRLDIRVIFFFFGIYKLWMTNSQRRGFF